VLLRRIVYGAIPAVQVSSIYWSFVTSTLVVPGFLSGRIRDVGT
jgi:hypothetical protein